MAELIKQPFGMVSRMGPVNCVFDGLVQWHHLVNVLNDHVWRLLVGLLPGVKMWPVSKLLWALLLSCYFVILCHFKIYFFCSS